MPSLNKIYVSDGSAKKNLLEKLNKNITESKKIKLGEDYIKFLAYIVNVKIVKKFASITEDKKKKIIEALLESSIKKEETKKTKSGIEKIVADLKSENLKDTLEKVLDSYKYEKISAKNKFEVFDAAIEMLKDILRAYGFYLKTETIKNDPDLKQYHHETGVTPGEIINYFDSEKEKYENGKNGSDSNQWENIVQVKPKK